MPKPKALPAPVEETALVPAPPDTALWRSRIVGHGLVDPRTLLPNPQNWRLHSRFQSEAMIEALDRLGWIAPVTINQPTGLMLDGHMRVALAIEKGEPFVPVDYTDLDPEEEALALATRDPLATLAEAQSAVYHSLLDKFAPLNGALGQMIEDLRERYRDELAPPSMDDLEKKYKNPAESDFWPCLNLALPPEVHTRYRELLGSLPGDEEWERFVVLLDAAEGLSQGDTLA